MTSRRCGRRVPMLDQTIAMLGGPSFDPAKPYEHPSVVEAQRSSTRPS